MKKSISAFLFAVALSQVPAAAQTFYVGSCHAGSFASIDAAISSSSVPSGATIDVCPGNYNEQVIISKPLTLQGITSNNSDAAVIGDAEAYVTAPLIKGGNIRPTVWVTAGPVNISNLTILESPASPACANSSTAGIYYASGAYGTVNHADISLSPAVGGNPCTLPVVGLWAENSSSTVDTVTIKNSTIEASDMEIYALGGQPAGSAPVMSINITGNLISIANNGLGYYGVYLDQATGSISGNFISGGFNRYGAQYAIVSNNPAGAPPTLRNNTVNAETGLLLGGSGATVQSNRVRATTGVNLNCLTATVSQNSFFPNLSVSVSIRDAFFKAPAALSTPGSFFGVYGRYHNCP